jgi:RimJ/RimL family protein N-acetyltransferase
MIWSERLRELYGPTRRLSLRPLAAADAGGYRALYQCLETMRFIGPVLSDPAAESSFALALKLQDELTPRPDWRLRMAISESQDSPLLGLLAVDACPAPDGAELGVLMHSGARGRGLGYEALDALTRRLKRIGTTWAQLCVDRHNEPMLRLASRLGYQAVGAPASGHARVVCRCEFDSARGNSISGGHTP